MEADKTAGRAVSEYSYDIFRFHGSRFFLHRLFLGLTVDIFVHSRVFLLSTDEREGQIGSIGTTSPGTIGVAWQTFI